MGSKRMSEKQYAEAKQRIKEIFREQKNQL